MNLKKKSGILSSLIAGSLICSSMPTYSFASNFEDLTIVSKKETNYKNNSFKIALAKMMKSEIVEIPDKILLAEINSVLKKGESEPVTKAELESLTSLRILSDDDLTSLEGLQYAINLEKFTFEGSFGSNVSVAPIKSLTKLKELILFNCDFYGHNDVFSNLKDLEELHLYRVNNLTNLSHLSKLENLKSLDLDKCNLNDKITETFGDMENLKKFSIREVEKITNIDFIKKMKNLEDLYLYGNESIKDISPILELDNLKYLDLSECPSINFSLIANLKSLQSLDISYCDISDIQFLKDFTSLESLSLDCNHIQDISAIADFKNLSSLEELNLSDNYIQDVSALSKFKNLKTLHLSSNFITSLEPLKELETTWISAYDNLIADFTPVKKTGSIDMQTVFITAVNNNGVVEFENPLKKNDGTLITKFELIQPSDATLSVEDGKITISNIVGSPDFLILYYTPTDSDYYFDTMIVNLLPEQESEITVDVNLESDTLKEWATEYVLADIVANSSYYPICFEHYHWTTASSKIDRRYFAKRNGKHPFLIWNTKGDIHIETFEINNIDKIPPEMKITVTPGQDQDLYDGKYNIIKVEANDNLSGIEKIVLPTGEERFDSVVSINNLSLGELTFTVYDKAGNMTTQTINIESFEQEPSLPDGDNSGGQETPPVVGDENKPSIPPEEDDKDENDTENNNPSTPDNNPQLPPSTDDEDKVDGEDNDEFPSIPGDEIGNTFPNIYAKNVINLIFGSSFNPLSGVTAYDEEDGDLTDSIEVIENNVNTEKVGKYNVKLSVTDKDKARASIDIEVNVLEEEYRPVLTSKSEKITLQKGENFNPLDYMQAMDKTDGDISNNIKVVYHNVDINNPGTYSIRYNVTNSLGIDAEKVLTVEVRDNNQDNNNNNDNNNNSSNNSTNTNNNDNTITGKPQTGDSSVVGYVVGAGLSALALWLLNRKKKKNTTDENEQ